MNSAAVRYGIALSFSALASQYVLRPVRDAMGASGHVSDLPRLFLFTLLGTLVVAPLVARLAARVPRRSLVKIFYRLIGLSLLVFVVAMRGGEVSTRVARAFFVASSVTNLFIVSLGWSLLVDVFRREQGAKIFGFIAAGGTMGALAGSGTSALLAHAIGTRGLIVCAVIFLELGAQAAGRLVGGTMEANDSPAHAASLAEGVLARARPLFRNRYVLGVAAYMLLYTCTSTFVYLDQARIVKAALPAMADRTALFARVDLAVNLASLVIQALLTRTVLQRLGAGGALAVLPALSLLGFVGIRMSPVLATIVVVQVVRRAVDYGLSRPARELLFTVGAPNEKYEAKNFLDTFVYRAGDAAAASAFEAIAPALGPAVLLVSAPICILWLAVSLGLGSAFHARSKA